MISKRVNVDALISKTNVLTITNAIQIIMFVHAEIRFLVSRFVKHLTVIISHTLANAQKPLMRAIKTRFASMVLVRVGYEIPVHTILPEIIVIHLIMNANVLERFRLSHVLMEKIAPQMAVVSFGYIIFL